MRVSILDLLATGYLLGWSVAWPPGPINAEVARRCLARGFWAGYLLILGASSADAVWAVLVALGAGVAFTTPGARNGLGVVSLVLLLALAALFLRGAWRAARGVAGPARRLRFEGRRAGYFLGFAMAAASPWNVAFWLAAVGRPEMTQLGLRAMLIVAAAVIGGALSWGMLWCGSVVALHRGAGGKWWEVVTQAATGVLMLYFAAESMHRLVAG